jgi:CheY-like chemotaxis protein
VDDLLDVARVTSGKIRLRRGPVDLGGLVERTVQAFTAGGRAKGHAPQVTVEAAWVDADETRIEQVVTNLVENAVKFTPVGEAIRVAVRRDGAAAVLEVSDRGRGISAEFLPRVFDLFAHGDATPDRAEGGLGLGLALVQRLVHLHGGTIVAASAGVGQGATFTVRLPIIPTPTPAEPARADTAAAPQRILVIDDAEDNREMLRILLTLEGHHVTAAPDGASGIEQVVAERPDVIIVDIGLPGLDGYEVARRLRAPTFPYRPRLVALTGYGQPEDRRRAEKAGFDAHLVKPAAPEALRAAIGPGAGRAPHGGGEAASAARA